MLPRLPDQNGNSGCNGGSLGTEREFRLKGGITQMKSLMMLATLLTVAVFLSAAAAPIGGGVPAAVHYIGHDKVSAVMAKGGAIVTDPGLIVLANRREAGQVEYHEHTNHIFIMVEGEATLVTGGTKDGAKQTNADQTAPAPLETGETYDLRHDHPL